MSSNFEKLREEQLSEVEKYEKENDGKIEDIEQKQFFDELHTMQMKDAYRDVETIKVLKSIAKELSGFDAIDLIDLNKYERILSGEQSNN